MAQPTSTVPPKRGCWFYGCISLAVVVLFLGVGAFVAARFTLEKVNQYRTEFTGTSPAQLERVELPPAELKSLQQRMDTFKTALDQQREPTELILTEHEINALIEQDPNFKDLRGKVNVSIQGDQIRGKISVPLQDIGPIKLQGRYLNGETGLRLSLQNGRLQVNLDDVQVNGKPLPPALMNELRNKNFAEDATRDPKNAEAIAKFESIRVEDGKVILRSKGKTN